MDSSISGSQRDFRDSTSTYSPRLSTSPQNASARNAQDSPGFSTDSPSYLASQNASARNAKGPSSSITAEHFTSSQNGTTSGTGTGTGTDRRQSTSATTCGETSSESCDDEVILSVYWKKGLLGAASYSLDNPIIYVFSDVADDRAMDFQALKAIVLQVEPTQIVTSEGMPQPFVEMIKKLITVDGDTSPPRAKFHLLPSVEFRDDNCMRRVLGLRLPSKPKDWTDDHHVRFLRTLIDFNAHCMIQALGGLLKFIDKNLSFFTGTNEPNPFVTLKTMSSEDVVHIDQGTYRALGILPEKKSFSRWAAQNDCTEKPSVFGLFDRCRSALGSKFMKSVFLKPTKDLRVIAERQEVVAFCMDMRNDEFVRNFQNNISQVRGVSSLFVKLRGLQANTLMWKNLHTTLQNILHIAEICGCLEKITFFSKFRSSVTSFDLAALTRVIGKIVDFEAPEGQDKFVVLTGIDETLDRMKKIYAEMPTILNKMAGIEIQDLPQFVPQCVVTYYPELGFLLAVEEWQEGMTKREMKIPGYDYMFYSNGSIYYKSRRCKDLDEMIGDPLVQIAQAQLIMMVRLVEYVEKHVESIIDAVNLVAELDCLISFATVAREHNYVRPKMTKYHMINIVQGRHLLEESFTSSFVPNDVRSGGDFGLVKIITGANNSGKTVYLKQSALIVFLAHLGSFVPAQKATIEVMDRICTRIRTAGSTAQGTSSFMNDICQISKAITSDSSAALIIIDEFGRSTEASDGKALLAASLNYLIRRGPSGCPHVFTTTHFHCLRKMLVDTPLVTEHRMDHMITAGGEITTLYRLVDGHATCSMAIQAAVIAGSPQPIVDRAKELMSGNARALVIDTPIQAEAKIAMVEAFLETSIETEEDLENLIHNFHEKNFL